METYTVSLGANEPNLRGFLGLVNVVDIPNSDDPMRKAVYRGESNKDWKCLPKIDRLEAKQILDERKWNRDQYEQWLIQEFKKRARPHLTTVPETEYEWLALGQHYGLVTRLLDWSYNPLIALYFAVADQYVTTDSLVRVYAFNYDVLNPLGNPYNANSVALYDPPHVSTRIAAQSSCFTSHPPDGAEWNGISFDCIIPSEARTNLRNELRILGISAGRLMPGLDGIAEEINQQSCNIYELPDWVRRAQANRDE